MARVTAKSRVGSVTVRAASGGATTVKFQIASASAAGSIVYWAADPGSYWNQNVDTQNDATSILRGFKVGEEGVVDPLILSKVQQPSRDMGFNVRKPTCIGCHSATPDPGFVSFVDNWPWGSAIAGVQSDNEGAQLPSLSVGGLAALNKPWTGPATFSSQNWQTNKRMVTTSAETSEFASGANDTSTPAKLVWYNLDSPAPPITTQIGPNQQPVGQLTAGNYGIIDRGADNARGAAFATKPSGLAPATLAWYRASKSNAKRSSPTKKRASSKAVAAEDYRYDQRVDPYLAHNN